MGCAENVFPAQLTEISNALPCQILVGITLVSWDSLLRGDVSGRLGISSSQK